MILCVQNSVFRVMQERKQIRLSKSYTGCFLIDFWRNSISGKTHRQIILIIFLVGLFNFTGCSRSHIRHVVEKVSRDYIYIDFIENENPFRVISEVGGEHMTFYKVLAFENDEFRVTLTTLDGMVFFSVAGTGVYIESLHDPTIQKKVVKIKSQEAVFSIELSAHPYGKYQLEIQKIVSS